MLCFHTVCLPLSVSTVDPFISSHMMMDWRVLSWFRLLALDSYRIPWDSSVRTHFGSVYFLTHDHGLAGAVLVSDLGARINVVLFPDFLKISLRCSIEKQ